MTGRDVSRAPSSVFAALPFVALVVALVAAAGAWLLRSSAESERRDGESVVTELEAELAAVTNLDEAASLERGELQGLLQQYTAEASEGRAGIDALGVELAELAAAEPEIVSAVGHRLEALGPALELLDERHELGQQMLAARWEQVEAVQFADYPRFNQNQDRYALLGAAWDAVGDTFAETAASLTDVAVENQWLASAETAVLAPPTGPARVVGWLPEVIPFIPDSSPFVPEAIGVSGWWDYEVVFTETNALDATITEIGLRYIDRRGDAWWNELGEFRAFVVDVAALGEAFYFDSVHTADFIPAEFDGGTLVVSWRGIDAEGNAFSGEVRATLERAG